MRSIRRGSRAASRLALVLALIPALLYGEEAWIACPAEIQRASDTLAKIFRQWPLRPSGDPVAGELQTVALQLASQAGEQTHRRWRTHVIRDSKLNAFSIGDGHIFVTEGMLRFVASEAELAALLAHEFAHHMAGHFCQTKRRAGVLRNLFGGNRTGMKERKVGELRASVDPVKEREADRIGAVILERGGYNPRAAVLLAARMSATGTPAHFQYGQRIEALQALLADKPPRGNWGPSDSAAFTRMKRALIERRP